MILHYAIVFVAVFTIPTWGNMIKKEFEEYIEDLCFTNDDNGVPRVNGQQNPLASTIENFISLVEKFEVANPNKPLREVIFYFIRNFTYTNIEYNSLGDIVQWMPKDAIYKELEVMWEPDDNLRGSIPRVEDPFTDAEKCSLYFMISHSIVRKARKVQEQRAPTNGNNGTFSRYRKWGPEIVHNDDDLYPQEQGVVAIQGTDEAVALGRVLTGMYVGMNPSRRIPIDSINRIPREHITSPPLEVDPLYTLTVAEVIAMSSWRPEAGQRQFLAPNGHWMSVPVGTNIDTSDICPMVYKLQGGTENAYSYSSLRGAADGLILGKVSGRIESRKRDAKLSQILRQYYSRGGLVEQVSDVEVGEIRATFCNRDVLLNTWDEKIKEQVRLFLLIASTSYKNIDDNLAFTWNKYVDVKKFGVLKNNAKEIRDYCGVPVSVDKPEDLPLETPLDVIAVLDTATEENLKKQQLIIGSLAKRLQLSYSGSRMTIFTDQKVSPPSVSVPGTIYLKSVVDDTYSPACAACYVTQIAPDSAGSIPEDEVIMALNQHLIAKKEEESKHSGVNGKVIILFNFDDDLPVGRPNAQQVRLEKALRELYLEHQDVSIFALGKNVEVLKKYARNDATYVMDAFDPSEEEIGKMLYDKVIAAPGKLQYVDCSDVKNERGAVFENYVTPNGVQHWSMPAKYFYKSFNLKLQFESFYGDIKVCHSRSTHSPELQKESCTDLTAMGKPLEFKHSNPCKGFTDFSCAPFYFSVIGMNNTVGQDKDYCEDKLTENKCKTLDQIKFKISHEGIRCSGSTTLLATPLSALFALIISHLLLKLV